MIADRLGRRYARALFEIALEDGKVDAVGAELESVAAVVRESTELHEVLTFPTHSAEVRLQVFAEVADRLGVSGPVRNFLRLLLDRNRMSALEACVSAYQALSDQHLGQVRGEVVSAQPLTDEQLGAVRERLERMTGKRVLIEARQAPDLIGGIVARVGNTLYDGSLKARLEGMKRAMSDTGLS